MSDFSFLAVSNVQGMRFLRYIKVFGIGILFGVCLFFLIYFIIVYRRKKSASKQAHRYNEKVLILEQELCIQNIMKASEKLKVSLFIEYLEKFVTTASYANISELLVSQGFIDKDIQEIERVLYANDTLSKHLTKSIHRYFIR